MLHLTEKSKIISDSSHCFEGSKIQVSTSNRFQKCEKEITSALDNFDDLWCKQGHVKPYTLKAWK